MMTNISLSVLYGGPDSEIVEPIIRGFKNHIMQLGKSYSDSIESIKITLCVSGNIHNYKNKIGIDQFKYEKRHKRISIVLVVPKKVWVQGNAEVVRSLKGMISESSQMIKVACENNDIQFNTKAFEKDLSTGISI
jgi:hypothetical protein